MPAADKTRLTSGVIAPKAKQKFFLMQITMDAGGLFGSPKCKKIISPGAEYGPDHRLES